MKDLQLRSGTVVRTSRMKNSHHHLADYLKKIAPKSMPHEQHDYDIHFFSQFNQSNC